MEGTKCEMRRLFLTFYEVMTFCEGLTNTADAKILFKSAKITENACLKLQCLNAVEDFESKLNDFWTMKGFQPLPLHYFQKSSHLVLCRYLTDSKFNENEVKLAIKEFILYRSEQEFLQIAQNLNSTQNSVKRLSLIVSGTDLMLSRHKAMQCLEQLKQLLACANNKVEIVSYEVTRRISNDEQTFKTVLGVMSLPIDDELTSIVQELIVLIVCKVLKNTENMKLYRTVLQLNEESFSKIVAHWSSFSDTIIMMVELSMKTLKCKYSDSSFSWSFVGNEKGLTFEEIITLINKIKVFPKQCARIKELLLLLSNEGFGLIAEDVMRICNIS